LIQISIPVSTRNDEWTCAEILREEFVHLHQTLAVQAAPEVENAAEPAVELCARFLAFIANSIDNNKECKDVRISLLLSAFRHFTTTYLSTKDIHTLTSAFDTEARNVVLASYFLALATLRESKVSDIPSGPQSALLDATAKDTASLFALFGGQGTNEVYFDELQSLYDVYKPFISQFLTSVTLDVLLPLSQKYQDTAYFTHGLDIISWLNNPEARPTVSYLSSVPVSFPLIGLTQLVQYLVACHVIGITPGELRGRIAGATGHSQGIVSAVAIAASTSFESFAGNAKKALKWLVLSGLRGQQAFPVVSVEPSLVQDALEGGEGAPSPMLSVTGLSLKDLMPHIEKTNKYLTEQSKLHVSLHNGPRAFVITGPAKSLYGLVTNLRKIRAPSGLDQSKVPFSQRKQVFSTRFLVVGVPYHSAYLSSVTEKIMKEDLNGEELWTAKDLGIPVFNTEDGQSFVP
jgi:fatty acid synthase subunit alpha, fungi type